MNCNQRIKIVIMIILFVFIKTCSYAEMTNIIYYPIYIFEGIPDMTEYSGENDERQIYDKALLAMFNEEYLEALDLFNQVIEYGYSKTYVEDIENFIHESGVYDIVLNNIEYRISIGNSNVVLWDSIQKQSLHKETILFTIDDKHYVIIRNTNPISIYEEVIVINKIDDMMYFCKGYNRPENGYIEIISDSMVVQESDIIPMI